MAGLYDQPFHADLPQPGEPFHRPVGVGGVDRRGDRRRLGDAGEQLVENPSPLNQRESPVVDAAEELGDDEVTVTWREQLFWDHRQYAGYL